MSDVNEATKTIIECVNEATSNLDNNERAMVWLFVNEMCRCAIELDILETLRPPKKTVVRCCDCQHFITSGASEISFCARVDYEMNPDDFCSYGKRKEGGE